MASTKMPSGSSNSNPSDGRPRAQVSYEGEDEFSTMSLNPERKNVMRSQNKLKPVEPGGKQEVKVNELKATNDQGKLSFLRKIFSR